MAQTLPARPTNKMEELGSTQQRHVLEAIAQLRKYGLEGILSLPQLVVCGDQSSGKSSVLEALTEIPFPRSDNLCTRFATEIILRKAPKESLTMKIIPDSSSHSAEELKSISSFIFSITDLSELPQVMEEAKKVMGIASDDSNGDSVKRRAFTRDVLSIEAEGPTRPHLTLVDLPGLIQTDTKGVTKEDVPLVQKLTEDYIVQGRTICLAVIAASYDHSNQSILRKVRDVDQDGVRSLGIITKPDKCEPGSGNEVSFINLANNGDVIFELGWHVLKNRKFEEKDVSLETRNTLEASFFESSAWSSIPSSNRGIDNLRERLSELLFKHVSRELPVLQSEIASKITITKTKLEALGIARSTPVECRAYLTKFSMDLSNTISSALGGRYDDQFFCMADDEEFSVHIGDAEDAFTIKSNSALRRFRAVLQLANRNFARKIRTRGHTWDIEDDGNTHKSGHTDWTKYFAPVQDNTEKPDTEKTDTEKSDMESDDEELSNRQIWPVSMSRDDTLAWVGRAITRTRGEELDGAFNPRIIPQLFREQSQHWSTFALQHLNAVHDACGRFLAIPMLDRPCGERVFKLKVCDILNRRKLAAESELNDILNDMQGLLASYNHYSTDNSQKIRKEHEGKLLTECADKAGLRVPNTQNTVRTRVDGMIKAWKAQVEVDTAKVAQAEALTQMLGLYKEKQKIFVDNVTTQVIERHLVRGLENIFTAMTVTEMTDDEVVALAGEQMSTRRERANEEERLKKLGEGKLILENVMRIAVA